MGIHAHGVEYFGALCEESSLPSNPPAVDVPLVDAEIEAEQEGLQPEAEGGDHKGDLVVQVEIPEKIYVEGLELKATSSVYDLRRICRFFGINQSGSKRKMYERIVHCHVVALRRQALEMYEQQYRAEVIDPQEGRVPIKQPSLRERRLHELTHLPFRPWCPHCTACKSRPDHKKEVTLKKLQLVKIPQFSWISCLAFLVVLF